MIFDYNMSNFKIYISIKIWYILFNCIKQYKINNDIYIYIYNFLIFN